MEPQQLVMVRSKAKDVPLFSLSMFLFLSTRNANPALHSKKAREEVL